MKERLFWIDAIKGICIFAVLLNHAGFSQAWFKVEYFFLVGFFFCSGYTFSLEKGLKSRMVRIVDSLLIPYFILSFVTYFLIINHITSFISKPGDELLSLLKSILFGYECWFIPCLISTELIYAVSLRFKIIDWVVLGGIILYLTKHITGMGLPWHIDTAMYSVIFFHLGYKTKELKFIEKMNFIPLWGCIVFTILFVIAGNYFFPKYPFNTSINEFTNEPLTLLGNIWGIFVLVLISKHIPYNRYLDYLGRNSLVLFFIHIPFVYYGYQLLSLVINLKCHLFDNSIFGIIYIFLITLILYPICSFLNRFSVLVGKGRIFEYIIGKTK